MRLLSTLVLATLSALASCTPLLVSKHERIVGGDPASLADFPWQVSLRNTLLGFSHFCGGIVIDKRWVLTAAHCVDGIDGFMIQVVAGQRYLDIPALSTQIAIPSKVIMHPDYGSYNNDVALLKLLLPFRDTDYVSPGQINLDSNLEEGTNCNVTGWGVTSEDSILPAFQLRRAAVDIVGHEKCSDAYAGVSLIDELTMICAGAEGRDSCGGDSGGPLTCEVNGERVVAGVVSFGYGCARPEYPGVYAKTANFVDWIREIMEENSD